MKILRKRNYPVEILRVGNLRSYRVIVFNKLYEKRDLQLAVQARKSKIKIVFDLCDNHFYNPSADPVLHERAERLEQMLALADVVTVPSPELQKYIGVPSHIIRDGVRPLSLKERLQRGVVARFRRRHRHNLVWFGNWGGVNRGGMIDLLMQKDLLTELSKRHDVGLTIISNNKGWFDQHFHHWEMPIYYQKWRSDTQLRQSLARFDVCLLPIHLNPFTLCKSNNRLALALYLGLPVVADPIPAYKEFAPYCVLGDWNEGLEAIISGRRVPDVEGGKGWVERNYTTAHAASDWQNLFDNLL